MLEAFDSILRIALFIPVAGITFWGLKQSFVALTQWRLGGFFIWLLITLLVSTQLLRLLMAGPILDIEPEKAPTPWYEFKE